MKYDFKRLIAETAWVEEPFLRKYRAIDYPSVVKEFEQSDAMCLVKEPSVSICILVYNKKPFLRECVNSVLNQKTDFPIEIVLAEDKSTDGSRELCFELQREHPDIIRVIYASANVGVMKNTLRGLSRCRGRIAACIDGDDYYATCNKLQSHVDYLTHNPDCSLVYSAAYTQYENYRRLKTPNSVAAKRERMALEHLGVEDMARSILLHNPMAAVSPVFRMSAARSACERIKELYRIINWFPCQDFELWFFIAMLGRVHYIPVEMVVYRLNRGAVTASDTSISCARTLGDVRNKLAIAHQMGDGCFPDADQVLLARTFAECLRDYCAACGRLDIADMPYVKSLFAEEFTEEVLRNAAARIEGRRRLWESKRSPLCFLVKSIVLRIQNATYGCLFCKND